jgi:hypothetical protein
MPHTPLAQLAAPLPLVGPEQTWPQAPQLLLSALWSLQPLLQQAGVVPVHAVQTVPPVPQMVTVVLVTHVVPLQQPLQPLDVVQTHVPPAQVVPVGQTWPQLPQFCASVCRFAHAVPHTDCPLEQVVTVCEQVAGGVHFGLFGPAQLVVQWGLLFPAQVCWHWALLSPVQLYWHWALLLPVQSCWQWGRLSPVQKAVQLGSLAAWVTSASEEKPKPARTPPASTFRKLRRLLLWPSALVKLSKRCPATPSPLFSRQTRLRLQDRRHATGTVGPAQGSDDSDVVYATCRRVRQEAWWAALPRNCLLYSPCVL